MNTPNNRVSMGRDMNHEPVCKTCPHIKLDPNRWGGWCQHPGNRVYAVGWPQGFTPSQGSDGGCDLHPAKRISGVKTCRYTSEPGGACWRQGAAIELCTCHDMNADAFRESVKAHAECRAAPNGVTTSCPAQPENRRD